MRIGWGYDKKHAWCWIYKEPKIHGSRFGPIKRPASMLDDVWSDNYDNTTINAWRINSDQTIQYALPSIYIFRWKTWDPTQSLEDLISCWAELIEELPSAGLSPKQDPLIRSWQQIKYSIKLTTGSGMLSLGLGIGLHNADFLVASIFFIII
jgi:hypothetical protein